jgi:hypothetical protein
MLVINFLSALVFVLVFTCCALLVSALAVVALSTGSVFLSVLSLFNVAGLVALALLPVLNQD